ncbi:hypothetical protein ACP70R_037423 [Stipagrostis hirtigluma subsp. patula]
MLLAASLAAAPLPGRCSLPLPLLSLRPQIRRMHRRDGSSAQRRPSARGATAARAALVAASALQLTGGGSRRARPRRLGRGGDPITTGARSIQIGTPTPLRPQPANWDGDPGTWYAASTPTPVTMSLSDLCNPRALCRA